MKRYFATGALVSAMFAAPSAPASLLSIGAEAAPAVSGPPAGMTAFPTAAFDRNGRLWAVWVEDSHVVVAVSPDRGVGFGDALRVTREPESIDANGDARPKIAIGPGGEIYVAWTRSGAKPFTGDIRFARSTDGGRTFSDPRVINDDGLATGHRFETLGVNGAGELFLVWIDKRDLEAATAAGRAYAGAALYYTWSTDRGATFAANRKIKDHVCECCRLAVAFENGRWPVLLWRDVLDGGIRDHQILRFTGRHEVSVLGRVSADNWRIDGCPHHGPGFAIDAAGVYHAVWATGEGPQGAGSFYARSADRGRRFSEPVRLGSAKTLAHAAVAAVGRQVTLVWKDRPQPGAMAIFSRASQDGGLTWGESREVARTSGWSDHPLLLSDGQAPFVTWYTNDEGLRVFDLGRQAHTTQGQ